MSNERESEVNEVLEQVASTLQLIIDSEFGGRLAFSLILFDLDADENKAISASNMPHKQMREMLQAYIDCNGEGERDLYI